MILHTVRSHVPVTQETRMFAVREPEIRFKGKQKRLGESTIDHGFIRIFISIRSLRMVVDILHDTMSRALPIDSSISDVPLAPTESRANRPIDLQQQILGKNRTCPYKNLNEHSIKSRHRRDNISKVAKHKIFYLLHCC